MEDLIRIIVDADNKAKAMENTILQEKEELNSQIEEEAKKIYEKYMKDAEESVKKLEQNEEKRAKKQIDDILNKQQSTHIKLQSDYQRNCDNWVNEIVKRTLA